MDFSADVALSVSRSAVGIELKVQQFFSLLDVGILRVPYACFIYTKRSCLLQDGDSAALLSPLSYGGS